LTVTELFLLEKDSRWAKYEVSPRGESYHDSGIILDKDNVLGDSLILNTAAVVDPFCD
jgi:hypothetical protein